ncbi:DUF5959 family protein [Streptomyces sp. NPDC002580]|uniref:DUF5959 family protein n=1 Tax=Streptomyces sp. NPDC002580 TaxID=3364653 RepID=UPI00369FFB0B
MRIRTKGECRLDALQAEEGADRPAGGRSAWVDVVPEDPVEVTVHDSPSTQIAVRVPIDVASGWSEGKPAAVGSCPGGYLSFFVGLAGCDDLRVPE